MQVSNFVKVLFLVLVLCWTACNKSQGTGNNNSTTTNTATPTPRIFADIEAIRNNNRINNKAIKDSSDFLKLVSEGDVDWVKDLLKTQRDKIDINERDKGNRSALIIAAKNSDVEMAKVLLETDIDVNLQDTFGSTALMHAIARNNKEFIDLLFTKNVNVNLKDGTGMSPLMRATGIRDAELRDYVVKELIARKAELNIKSQNGMSVLDYAEPYPETAKLIKKAGAR
ncbi:MAG: ankyrin repeat domain-containing protein [Acidobacteria bacterium]|nr:ankyrin repeat domain-containing protein [Acidobacteriota bacterium]